MRMLIIVKMQKLNPGDLLNKYTLYTLSYILIN